MRPCGWRCPVFSCDASRKSFFHFPSVHSVLLIWCSCASLLCSESCVPYVWPSLLHGFSYLPGESVSCLVTLATYTIGGHTSIVVVHITCLLAIRLALLSPVASIVWVKFQVISFIIFLPASSFRSDGFCLLDTASQLQLDPALAIFWTEITSSGNVCFCIGVWFWISWRMALWHVHSTVIVTMLGGFKWSM